VGATLGRPVGDRVREGISVFAGEGIEVIVIVAVRVSGGMEVTRRVGVARGSVVEEEGF